MLLCITIHLCNTMTTCKEEAHQSESSGHLVHCLLLPHPASCLPQWGSLALDLPSKSFVEFLAYVYSQQIADCDFFWVFIKKIIKIIIFLNSSLFQNHNLSIIAYEVMHIEQKSYVAFRLLDRQLARFTH